MPIKTQSDLPAKEILEKENIFVMDENRATHQDIRAINIAILNLMPLKEDTELQLLRSLSNTPLQVDVTFVAVSSHESKNTSMSHLNKFYETFADIKNRYFDGLIITGAPVEQMEYEEVDYWKEMCEIFEWSKTHATSTLHLCWGAQAGLYYHYGLKKYLLPEKKFGVYEHHVMNRKVPLVRGFDDYFMAPHSRHTEVRAEDIRAVKELTILAESEEAGVFLAIADEGRKIFVMGHPEYDRVTLDKEYKRDKDKGLDIKMMYISTDYVFNGQGTRPWEPDDHREPLNAYGQSKYEGELAVEELVKKFFIVRIAWVFGVNGKNFIKTMLRVGKERGAVSVVDDQIGSPTYTYDLARLLVDMIQSDKYGRYHATNEGLCSWYDFAVEIFKQAGMDVKVTPVSTAEYTAAYPGQAKRPMNSRISKEKLSDNGFERLPSWQDAVGRYLKEIQ